MKQTDVPDGWKEVKLESLIARIDYGTATKSEQQGLCPVLRMSNLSNGKIDWSDLVYTSVESEIEKYKLKNKDILFNRTNSQELVGKTSIYNAERPAIFAGYLIRLRLNSQCDPDYLNYQMNSSQFVQFCQAIKTDAISQSNINAQNLEQYIFKLPPLPEQKAIVKTLSVWDNMVEKMELLIAKKEEVFKFVQQQLITLPSEKENWTKVKIKDVIKLITPPYKIEKDEYQLNGKYPIIDQSKADIDGWTDNAEYVVNEGMPLVIFGDHTCKVKIVDVPFAQGADGIKIMSISPLLNPFYFYHYLLANPIAAEGYMRHFSILTDKDLFYPSYERQKEIAEILNCYQNEINIMEELIAQYKLQKQGLMQKLLTGQWRIK